MREQLREQLTAKRACVVLGLGIAAYELACNDEELISRGWDRAMEHSTLAKVAVMVGTWATAMHLTNQFEALGIEKADPYKWLHSWTR